MCNATAFAGAQGFGAAQSAVGGYYAAQSQKSTLNMQANLADINARTAETTAQAALAAGQRQEQQVRLNTAGLKAAQTTSMAANGIALGEGSAQRILTSTDVMGEIDANTAAANAVRAAWGYRTQATNFQNQAMSARSAAGAISPGLALASGIMTGASKVASSWYGLSKVGMFSTGAGLGGSGGASTPGSSLLGGFFDDTTA